MFDGFGNHEIEDVIRSFSGCQMDRCEAVFVHCIKEEDLSRIFDPFFTTKEIGTGLGLAIVQKVVEGYNGNVSIYSSVGKGTKIVLSLPEPLNE